MKIWAKCVKDNKIYKDVVQEFALARPSDIPGWEAILLELCKELDLARPIVLTKHLKELTAFSRTQFTEDDFMESLPFDKFRVEILPEEKKKKTRPER